MKMRLLATACLAGVLLLPQMVSAEATCRLIRGAQTPTDPTDDVQVCRQDVWLHQAGTKLGNLAGAGQDTLPSWNTTKPSASLQSGAGAGYATVRLLDIAEPYNRTYRPTFEGKFTGTLDNLAVTLYISSPIYQALNIPWPLLVRLSIDGETVFEQSDVEIDVPQKPAGNFRKVEFALTNVYEAMKTTGLDLSSTKEHTIELSVIQRYWGDGHSVVFYDASDVPSGIVFNIEPTNLKPYTQIDTFAPPA
ncbi:MAG TPA: hypothetical protein VG602_09385 [Actinomycetota bacterium]|nr:hypothetical protein [Actinomycetota bacterium]